MYPTNEGHRGQLVKVTDQNDMKRLWSGGLRAGHAYVVFWNCVELIAKLKPHLLDSRHFEVEFVLLSGEMGK